MTEAGSQNTWEVMKVNAVTHTYHRENENSRFTLRPIDLTLVNGETVFFTGGNGCGKTTSSAEVGVCSVTDSYVNRG